MQYIKIYIYLDITRCIYNNNNNIIILSFNTNNNTNINNNTNNNTNNNNNINNNNTNPIVPQERIFLSFFALLFVTAD